MDDVPDLTSMRYGTIILVIASRSDFYDRLILDHWNYLIEYVKIYYPDIKILLLFGRSDLNGLNLKKDTYIKFDIDENYVPGILRKTIKGFKYIEDNYNYRYIFRTNLSSMILLDNFIEYINNLPTSEVYTGIRRVHDHPIDINWRLHDLDDSKYFNNESAYYSHLNKLKYKGEIRKISFMSGCGFLISRDKVQTIIERENDINYAIIDDVAIGDILKLDTNNHYYQEAKRYDIMYLQNYESDVILKRLNDANKNHYHIRVRNPDRFLDLNIFALFNPLFYRIEYFELIDRLTKAKEEANWITIINLSQAIFVNNFNYNDSQLYNILEIYFIACYNTDRTLTCKIIAKYMINNNLLEYSQDCRRLLKQFQSINIHISSSSSSTLTSSSNLASSSSSDSSSSSFSTLTSSSSSNLYNPIKDRKEDLSYIVDEIARILGVNVDPLMFNRDEITLVTMFHDPKVRKDLNFQQKRDYIALGEDLLKMPINMFIMADPHITPRIWKYRRDLNLLHRTFIYTLNFEDSPYYKYLNRVEYLYRINGHPMGYDHNRMTASYCVIGWSRLAVIDKATKLNPFNSKGFVWADYGLLHLYKDKQYGYDNLLKSLDNFRRDRIKMLILEHTHPNELKNLKNYYSKLRYKLAAGMFGGPTELMQWLANDFEINVSKCIKTEYPALDEMILNVSCTKYPEKFDFFYGDYHALCTNITNYKRAFYQVEITLRGCHDKMWYNTVKICYYMLRSIRYDQSILEIHQELKILDESILGLWYGFKQKNGLSIAKLLAERIVKLFETFPRLKVPSIIEHYNHNIGFFGLTIT